MDSLISIIVLYLLSAFNPRNWKEVWDYVKSSRPRIMGLIHETTFYYNKKQKSDLEQILKIN